MSHVDVAVVLAGIAGGMLGAKSAVRAPALPSPGVLGTAFAGVIGGLIGMGTCTEIFGDLGSVYGNVLSGAVGAGLVGLIVAVGMGWMLQRPRTHHGHSP